MAKCVIRGETIEHPGSRQDLGKVDISGIDKGEVFETDGFNTQNGPICKKCTPIYDEALARVESADPFLSPKKLRKAVKELIEDPAFVAEVIRDRTRTELEQAVSNIELQFPLEKQFLLHLRGLIKPPETSSPPVTDTTLPQGMLSPDEASACLLDEERSSAFIEAFLAKLKKLEKDRESVEIVDAGCGPIPIFGILAAIRSPKAKVTCLEINPASAQMAEEIIKYLGLEDQVKVVLTDATTYKHNSKIDLLISETMYAGLINEPQIQIMRNLVPQVRQTGTIIPEEITVEASLIPPYDKTGFPAFKDNNTGNIPILDKHFVLTPATVANYTRNQLEGPISFELDVSDIPDGHYHVTLGSSLRLGKNAQGEEIHLDGIASPITAHQPIINRVQISAATKKVLLQYEPGENLVKIHPTTT